MDAALSDAERDLAYNAKLSREVIENTRSRQERAKRLLAFDRAQRRFYYDRDRQCGGNRDTLGDSERANQIRECMIQLTRARSAQIGATLPIPRKRASVRSPAESTAKPAPSDPGEPAVRDPVYGIDWRLTRIIRDSKELALPPKYKANLRLETDGRVSGYGAASAFTGRYRLRSPGRIEWSENGFLITHDAQQPDPTGFDYLYIDALERINRAGLSKTGLVLRNDDGTISLSFER
jgi:hypothetical protein